MADPQPPAIPDDLLRLMAEVGPVWGTNVPAHVALMTHRFSEVLAGAPKLARVERDAAYGPHPRQVLDVYRPLAGRALPMVVFVHGGAFVDGVKDRTAEVYANVCWYLARHGVVAINMEYRLAPEFGFPAGADDVSLAVAWAAASAGRLDGDPGRVFVFGHSAGAAHAALFAYDRGRYPQAAAQVCGLIVVSGRVRTETLPDNPNAAKVAAYCGPDPAGLEAASAVNFVDDAAPPTLIAIAEFENPLIDVHCAELFHRLAQAKRRAPPLLRLAGHNHTSIIAHLNTAEERLGREILAFIARPA